MDVEPDESWGGRRKAKFYMVRDNQYYKNQILVYKTYQSDVTQFVVSALILLNFFIQGTKRVIDPACKWPHGECENEAIWHFFHEFFNIIFLMELVWNAAGSWWRPFVTDGWNWFDMLVVSVGTLEMLGVDIGKLIMLRMLRAFRIFRLFGRVRSIRKIIGSVFHALGGMLNAFLIVVIVMAICAVLAVDLFGNLMCAEDAPEWQQEFQFHGGKCFGRGYYGDFLTAFYTMFQILTGESWSERAVRPILDFFERTGDPVARAGVMLFFTGFITIAQFVLLNVVVTVLLDGMSQVPEEDEGKDEEEPLRANIDNLINDLEEKHASEFELLKKAVRAVATA